MTIDVNSQHRVTMAKYSEQSSPRTPHTFPEAQDAAFARQHILWCTTVTHECWPFKRAVLAMPADIRCAEQLRAQIRERYRGWSKVGPHPWCVGVD